MKGFVISVILSIIVSNSFAYDIDRFSGPVMPDVVFPHKVHQIMLRNCKECHKHIPGKIINFGRVWSHKVCRDCHKTLNRGPVLCLGCHKG